MMKRRDFLAVISSSLLVGSRPAFGSEGTSSQVLSSLLGANESEDIVSYLKRTHGRFDATLYRQILGAANEFKEGDQILGVAAPDQQSRLVARQLLSNTPIQTLLETPPWVDELAQWNDRFINPALLEDWVSRPLGDLKQFLLTAPAADIHQLLPGLTSDLIACLVRLMSNDELIQIGSTIFHPLHGSQIGAKGFLGARVQPNSPTDHVDDIRFQVFDAFAYSVGDVLLGNNPVSSDPRSVAAIEVGLQEILKTFGIDDVIPHCVLAHIDVQAEVERVAPGSTEFWFQSIAGNDAANATFDISLDKMVKYAEGRTGRYGLYLETGQGADFTNGHGHGTDMVFHESRKYGFARGLKHTIARAKGIPASDAWLHLNDVAGFIGPEVFRTREQLVRCCLEDIAMGKLHGLTIGLDVCSTLHMDVSLDDLDWCLEQIAPANPAYLMALPTKIDPMLGYLTTGYQDHVRLRQKFGYRIDSRMQAFFQRIGILDQQGQPTEHFGDPHWVYLQYCRHKHDPRSDAAILAESRTLAAEIRQRGVFIAEGYGRSYDQLAPAIRSEIQTIYEDAKQCIWKEWEPTFVQQIPNVVLLSTRSSNRSDYILHPATGEYLSEDSRQRLEPLRRDAAQWDVVVVISEGLNAMALMDEGNLLPLVDQLRTRLTKSGLRVATPNLVVNSGRVRAGYRIGEQLFGEQDGLRTIIHLIGERPGTGHHTLSAYLTTADGKSWKQPDQVDHNITRVVSGIGITALPTQRAADDILSILRR